ncbi:MAG TPA: ester cyclase [Dehalococcoidia bacterium]|nr:ester cyclase [Dehalococcoidia bacterium]
MDIREIAEKWMQADEIAFQYGDFHGLEEIESPDIIFHMLPAPDIVGFEAHKQYIVNGRKSITDLKQEMEYLTGDGNVCALSFKEQVTLNVDNPRNQISAGSPFHVNALFVLRCQNEKVVEIWMNHSFSTN